MNLLNTAKITKLVGKRWDILEALYQNESSRFPNRLAKRFGKALPWISTQLKELREAGLVDFVKDKDERLKRYSLTERGRRICEAIIEATRISNEEGKFEEWQINAFLDVIEDEKLSEDLRLSYSEEFYKLCRDNPTKVMEHERVKRLLLNIARNPYSNKISLKLKSVINEVTPNWLGHEETSGWVLKNLYPIFVRYMKDVKTGEDIRGWATLRIGEIARISPNLEIGIQAKKIIIDMYFSENVDTESRLAKELRQQLISLTSKSFFEEVKTKAESEDSKVKAKAENLLKEMKKYILSRPEVEEE